MKRCFDVVCAVLSLALCLPLFVIIAGAIKVNSPGPVIYRQIRVGLKERPFMIYKFRTLVDGSERPFDVVLKDDPRVTFVGKVLRATYMDELPQLVNVLKGDMSMVGPRPMSMHTVLERKEQIKDFSVRYAVLPGLTGLSQSRRVTRGNPRGPRTEHRLSKYYVRHHCFALDCQILWWTACTMVKRTGA